MPVRYLTAARESRCCANPSGPPNSPKQWRKSSPPNQSRQIDVLADPVRTLHRSSGSELLLEYPLFQIELAIKQQGHRNVAILMNIDGDDIAHLGKIGDRADRAFVGLERLDPDLRLMGQQRTAPATRAESADRG